MKKNLIIFLLIISAFIGIFTVITINYHNQNKSTVPKKFDKIIVKHIKTLDNEKSIFTNDLNNNILINYDNELISLNDALTNDKVSFSNILSKMSLVGILNDGGTKKYFNSDIVSFNKEFYIIVCNKNNKINYNKNIYISENEDIYIKCSE